MTIRPGTELMGAAEVASLLGVSRQRVNQLAHSQGFPEPIARLDAGRIWLGSDVRAWAADRKA